MVNYSNSIGKMNPKETVVSTSSSKHCGHLPPQSEGLLVLGAVVGVGVYQLMVGYNVEGEARIQRRREEEESLKCTTVTTINGEA